MNYLRIIPRSLITLLIALFIVAGTAACEDDYPDGGVHGAGGSGSDSSGTGNSSGAGGSSGNNDTLATNKVKFYALNLSDPSYDGERENFKNCSQRDIWNQEFKLCYLDDQCRAKMNDGVHDGRLYLLGDGDIVDDDFYVSGQNKIKCWSLVRYDPSCGAGFLFKSDRHNPDDLDNGSRTWLSHFDMTSMAPGSPSTCLEGTSIPIQFDSSSGDGCPLYLTFCARHDEYVEHY